jgi:hypothetical protein
VAGAGEVGACADVDCAGVAVLARLDACGGCETDEEESGQQVHMAANGVLGSCV